MGVGEKVQIPMVKIGGVLPAVQRNISDEEADAVISSVLCSGCFASDCSDMEVTLRPTRSNLEAFRVEGTESLNLPVAASSVAASSGPREAVEPPKLLQRPITPRQLFLPPSLPQPAVSPSSLQDLETPTSSLWASPKQAEVGELHNALHEHLRKSLGHENDWMSRFPNTMFSARPNQGDANGMENAHASFGSGFPHQRHNQFLQTGFSMLSNQTTTSEHTQYVVSWMAEIVQSPSQPTMDDRETTAMLSWKRSFLAYFAVCFGVSGISAAAAVLLWSEMGCAPLCLEGLQDAGRYARLLASLLVVALTVLYLLDFFCPPHMPGRYLILRIYGFKFGRSLAAVLVCMTLAVCFLMLNKLPTVPLAVTVFLAPITMLLLRYATLPERPSRPMQDFEEFEVRLAIAMLKELSVEEWDQKNFYSAAAAAFLLTSLACISAWLPWANWDETRFSEEMEAAEGNEKQAMLVAWAAPLFVFGSNLAFASFAGLRVALNRSYSATDELRNKIIGRNKGRLGERMMKYQITRLLKDMDQLSLSHSNFHTLVDTAKDQRQQFLVQRVLRARQLSNVVKSIGVAFVVMIGGVYVTFQITVAESEIAQAIQGFLFALFFAFLVFLYVSFNRVWRTMSDWVQDLPLWKSILSMSRSELASAGAVFLLVPLVPFVLALSAVNQRIRRCRKFDDEVNASASSKEPLSPSYGKRRGPAATAIEEGEEDEEAAEARQPSVNGTLGLPATTPLEEERRSAASWLFTARVNAAIEYTHSWDWFSVLQWCYIVGAMVIMYQVTPLALNIMLAWMRDALRSLNFGLIVISTFFTGLLLFMLPPVPGPPIYLFGGLVISDTCPWGFWWGTAVCIVVCFVMKLCACAVQQKLIGEKIGNSDHVRMMAGMHKPFMRAVRNVLARPGLSFGKCMILCGGPDWPISVLAGIMRLSLIQCMIGTCPIILSLVPLVLTGSFYLKRAGGEENEVWERMGSFMFSLTLLISVMFWAGMGWAIQDEFDRHNAELNRPRAEDLELDWRDYCAAVIKKRTAIKWRDIPRPMRWLFCAGALGMIATGHAHMWLKRWMYGDFGIDDKVGDLKFEDAVKPLGVIGLVVACVSFLCLCLFKGWLRHRSRSCVARVWNTLQQEEALWKERRLTEARIALQDAQALALHAASRDMDQGGLPPSREISRDCSESCIRSSAVASSAPVSPVASIRSLRDSAAARDGNDVPPISD